MPSPSFLARPPVRDRAGLRVPLSAGVCLRLSRYPSPRRLGLGLLRPLGSRLWLGLGLWSARLSAGPAAATPPSAPPRPPSSPAALALWARRPSPCTAARRGARRRLGGTRGVYNLVSWGSVCAGSLSVRPPLLPPANLCSLAPASALSAWGPSSRGSGAYPVCHPAAGSSPWYGIAALGRLLGAAACGVCACPRHPSAFSCLFPTSAALARSPCSPGSGAYPGCCRTPRAFVTPPWSPPRAGAPGAATLLVCV